MFFLFVLLFVAIFITFHSLRDTFPYESFKDHII